MPKAPNENISTVTPPLPHCVYKLATQVFLGPNKSITFFAHLCSLNVLMQASCRCAISAPSTIMQQSTLAVPTLGLVDFPSAEQLQIRVLPAPPSTPELH